MIDSLLQPQHETSLLRKAMGPATSKYLQPFSWHIPYFDTSRVVHTVGDATLGQVVNCHSLLSPFRDYLRSIPV